MESSTNQSYLHKISQTASSKLGGKLLARKTSWQTSDLWTRTNWSSPTRHSTWCLEWRFYTILIFEKAVREIARVTKRGGEILFIEPLLLNPVARVVRALTPKARTPDERPLSRTEINIINEYYVPSCCYTDCLAFPAALLSKLVRAKPDNWLTRTCDQIDAKVSTYFPWLGAYSGQSQSMGRNATRSSLEMPSRCLRGFMRSKRFRCVATDCP